MPGKKKASRSKKRKRQRADSPPTTPTVHDLPPEVDDTPPEAPAGKLSMVERLWLPDVSAGGHSVRYEPPDAGVAWAKLQLVNKDAPLLAQPRRVATFNDVIGHAPGAVARWRDGDPDLEPWFLFWSFCNPERALDIKVGGSSTMSIDQTFRRKRNGRFVHTRRRRRYLRASLAEPADMPLSCVPDAIRDWHPIEYGVTEPRNPEWLEDDEIVFAEGEIAASWDGYNEWHVDHVQSVRRRGSHNPYTWWNMLCCQRHAGVHPVRLSWSAAVAMVDSWFPCETSKPDEPEEAMCYRCSRLVLPYADCPWRCPRCGEGLDSYWRDDDVDDFERRHGAGEQVLNLRDHSLADFIVSPFYPSRVAAKILRKPAAQLLADARGLDLELAGGKFISDQTLWTLYRMLQAPEIIADQSCPPSIRKVKARKRTLTIQPGDIFGAVDGEGGLCILSEGPRKGRNRSYVCKCRMCGATTKPIRRDKIVRGETRSCGCLQKANRQAYRERVEARRARRPRRSIVRG